MSRAKVSSRPTRVPMLFVAKCPVYVLRPVLLIPAFGIWESILGGLLSLFLYVLQVYNVEWRQYITFSSPKGEAFQPSPSGTLNYKKEIYYHESTNRCLSKYQSCRLLQD